MAMAADKTAEDWVKAATRRLAAGGSESVAIEPLARDMGVTKGSFYWHFRDRRALLEVLIPDWESRATVPMLDRLTRMGSEPAGRLAAPPGQVAAGGGGSPEPAPRALGPNDPQAAASVRRGG